MFRVDLLPLKRGIFVEKSITCSKRSNATVISYWGNELNSSRTVGTIVKVESDGKDYTVTLDMNVMGEEYGEEIWNISIKNFQEIKIVGPGRDTEYKWCSEEM